MDLEDAMGDMPNKRTHIQRVYSVPCYDLSNADAVRGVILANERANQLSNPTEQAATSNLKDFVDDISQIHQVLDIRNKLGLPTLNLADKSLIYQFIQLEKDLAEGQYKQAQSLVNTMQAEVHKHPVISDNGRNYFATLKDQAYKK